MGNGGVGMKGKVGSSSIVFLVSFSVYCSIIASNREIAYSEIKNILESGLVYSVVQEICSDQ